MGFDIRPLICSVPDAFLASFGVVHPLNVSGIRRMRHWLTMSSFYLFYVSTVKLQRVSGQQHVGFDIRPLICSVLDAFVAPFGVVRPMNVSGIGRMSHWLNDE